MTNEKPPHHLRASEIGKTHTLLNRLDAHLDAGTLPDRIAFLTFTRRARREALERVEKRFNLHAKDLPYFTTIHALAFKGMKLKEGDVLDKDSIGKFGKIIGMKFTETRFSEQLSEGINVETQEGDYYLSLIELARLQGTPIETMWRRQTGVKPEWEKVDWFVRTYEAFKQEHGLLDFTDVLVQYAKKGEALELDAGFIDEAQDLSSAGSLRFRLSNPHLTNTSRAMMTSHCSSGQELMWKPFNPCQGND